MPSKSEQIDIFDKRVFALAKKLPGRMPEPFIALEEYDRTGKLPINFTLDPALYKEFKEYCRKNGRQMSSLLERAMKEKLKAQRIFK